MENMLNKYGIRLSKGKTEVMVVGKQINVESRGMTFKSGEIIQMLGKKNYVKWKMHRINI